MRGTQLIIGLTSSAATLAAVLIVLGIAIYLVTRKK
jgi:hypothetical protein